MTPRRFIHLIESGSAVQQYGQIWLQARTFFSEQQDALASLPEESEDRSRVEAALGIIGQYKMDDNSTDQRARDTALLLADRLEGMVDRPVAAGYDGEDDSSYERVHAFIHQLANDLREFHGSTRSSDVGAEPEGTGEAEDETPGGERRPHLNKTKEKPTDGPRDRDATIKQEV
jgi:hypothetical protein